MIWISNQLTTKTLEPQINGQTHSFETEINWQPKSVDSQIKLTTKPLESQINWQPNHWNRKSTDNQITWISDQLTTKSFESQINGPKLFESQIRWQPNHLNLKSDDSQIIELNPLESDIDWLSNQLNSTRPLPILIGSLWLETSATASCGRYVISIYKSPSNIAHVSTRFTFGPKDSKRGHGQDGL